MLKLRDRTKLRDYSLGEYEPKPFVKYLKGSLGARIGITPSQADMNRYLTDAGSKHMYTISTKAFQNLQSKQSLGGKALKDLENNPRFFARKDPGRQYPIDQADAGTDGDQIRPHQIASLANLATGITATEETDQGDTRYIGLRGDELTYDNVKEITDPENPMIYNRQVKFGKLGSLPIDIANKVAAGAIFPKQYRSDLQQVFGSNGPIAVLTKTDDHMIKDQLENQYADLVKSIQTTLGSRTDKNYWDGKIEAAKMLWDIWIENVKVELDLMIGDSENIVEGNKTSYGMVHDAPR